MYWLYASRADKRIGSFTRCSYYARVYMAHVDAQGKPQGEEIDVDARPSDAINFAIRAGVSAVHGCECEHCLITGPSASCLQLTHG